MVKRVKSAYRSQAERDEEDNVIPIRPEEDDLPPKPPRVWPWVVLAMLAGETAIAYGAGFAAGAFVYLGMLNLVVLAISQVALAHERRMELKEEVAEGNKYTQKLDTMAMKMLEDMLAYGSVSGKKRYEAATDVLSALKIMFPLCSEEERKDVERRIYKLANRSL